ncbi:MAG: HD domain-containing phosphohydrolase, partial [Thermodesulfobacteriota bacterium]
SPGGHYVLWAFEGHKVTPRQLEKLTDSGLKEVYIDVEEAFQYEEYLETNLGKILENQSSTVDQKAAIFSKVSTNVVRNAFESSFGPGTLGPESIKRTEDMINNALRFISESKSLQPLAQMIGHDYQTYEHATKVLWFTMAFLKEHQEIMSIICPGFEEMEEGQQFTMLSQCGVAALLHDIGKTYTSPDILNKNGPLTALEWEIMKRHPLNGLAILLGANLPEFAKKAVLEHHEDFNGAGYPMGLRGLHISILGRVLRIVDTFDAMTSRRPYKEPHSPKKAIEIMIGTPPQKKKSSESVKDVRDLGMSHCFDEDLLRKFILFLGRTKLDE